MKTARKAILLVLCAILLVVSAVMGTLAYLTDTEAVNNTFTVGKVDITLDEFDYDNDNNTSDNTVYNEEKRDRANEYHLIPGGTYKKDPTVTVVEASEESYVFMTVTVERLDQLEAALTADKYYGTDRTFLLQNLCAWNANDWKYVDYKATTTTEPATKTGVYRFVYKETVDGTDGRLSALFENITVPGDDITSDNIDNLKNVKVIVDAYAIQKAGFDSTTKTYDQNAADAWAALAGQLKLN